MTDLVRAVENVDEEAVQRLLAEGADPNAPGIRDNNGYAGPPVLQPDTPLTMVMFRLSDCMLTQKDLDALARIAGVLLAAGADPQPARVRVCLDTCNSLIVCQTVSDIRPSVCHSVCIVCASQRCMYSLFELCTFV